MADALAGLLFAVAAAVPAVNAQSAERDFAVRCGKLYRGPGQPLTDAVLVVRGGRVQQVLQGAAAPADLPLLDFGDKVVMPGIVAADTDLAANPDSDYNVTPDFVALDGFDYVRSHATALAGGVTTVYLAPGRNRLVPGQGSVVKLFGDDIVHRTLAEQACLHVTLGGESTRSPDLFEPTPHPTADDPLLPARRQYPSSRLSQLATLRQLFRDAAGAASDGLTGPGAAEDRYSQHALHRVAIGDLPLRIAAREAADLRRAVRFARELGTRAVLENPFEIAPVAALAAEQGASVVLRVPVHVSASNPGGEDRRDESITSDPRNAAIAARAGLRIALAPSRDGDLADYLLVAGIAVRHGLDPAKAFDAITADAAAILGVDDRVGTLDSGKDADFLVLSGEPFATGTMVERTYVDGRLAFERQTDGKLLAVRARRILTGDGRTIENGVVLVADGRIKGVGTDLAVPFGARIVSVPEGIVVPGFIDAHTSLGLSGDGTDVPPGSADQRVADAVVAGDPLFRSALEAGITTLLVSGPDFPRDARAGDRVAGRISAIKPGAPTREQLVLEPIAGIRFAFDSIDDAEVKTLADQIKAGRAYIEAWQKYEKAVADWKAGKGEKPPDEAAPPPAAPTADAVSGTWEVQIRAEIPVPLTMTLELALDGTKVTGSLRMRFGEQQGPAAEISEGSFENGRIRLVARAMGGEAVLEGTVADDSMSGTFTAGEGRLRGEFSGRRTATGDGTATAAAALAADGSGEPRKPAVQQNLEPIRAWLEKRAVAVVRTNRAPAIRNVIAMLDKEQLPYVLHDVGDAIETPAILGEKPPNVMLGPELVQRDGRDIVNAAAVLADRDVPLALASGDTTGSRYLPLHATHAIRYGMDPDAALRALTSGPARMFGIDDRVGSITRGKDADFVVFDGNPFEVTSRVLVVVAGGRVVVDNREESR